MGEHGRNLRPACRAVGRRLEWPPHIRSDPGNFGSHAALTNSEFEQARWSWLLHVLATGLLLGRSPIEPFHDRVKFGAGKDHHARDPDPGHEPDYCAE